MGLKSSSTPLNQLTTRSRSLMFFVAGIFVGFLLLSVIFFLFYSGRTYPGVTVASVAIGGKTIEESEDILRREISPKIPKKLTFVFENRSWEVTSEDINASLDPGKTAAIAFSYGRKGSVVGNLQAIASAALTSVNLPPVVNLHEDLLQAKLAAMAQEIDIPAEEPALTIDSISSQVSVSEGKDGRNLKLPILEEKVRQALVNFSTKPIELPVQVVSVSISESERQQAKQRAETLLGKTARFSLDGKTVNITGEELATLVQVQGGYEEDKIASLAAKLASNVDRSPQDATFQFESGKVTVFRPSKEGLELDQPTAKEKIRENLRDLEATSAASLTIVLPIQTKPPKVSTEEVNNLGIKELIGRGVSYFRGSIASRVHNIVLASSRINGTLVPPGEVFSFAKAVGDISAATGYQQAYIIERGRTILGDGGGTCQVSTTLFRAVLDSGLPIEERHAHAYRVSYYEQGGWQPGFDATVFVPNVDLKFKNDTPGHILVQAIPDTKNWTLTFELYGTKDGRKVSLSKARVWDHQPAPPERYEDDPTLPKGTIEQVDFAAAGAKAAFDYEVIKGGQVLQKRTFYSNFRPWQAVYLRGTRE